MNVVSFCESELNVILKLLSYTFEGTYTEGKNYGN